MKKVKVLWVEDSAISDLRFLLMPVYMAGAYDVTIALDVSEAVARIWSDEFDAVIVDIRLPPGNDPRWIRRYQQFQDNRPGPRLGLQLLYSLLTPNPAIVLPDRPGWLKPERFGVLTVEPKVELIDDLQTLRISVFEQKTTRTSSEVLVTMVEMILRQSGINDGG